MDILRNFVESGITSESVRSKSAAAQLFANYLFAMHQLQEHFLVVGPDNVLNVEGLRYNNFLTEGVKKSNEKPRKSRRTRK